MTHETKAGIIVATCFLGLIGGVFAVKYLAPTDPKTVEVVQTQPVPDLKSPPPDQDPPSAPVMTIPTPGSPPALLPPMTPASADPPQPIVMMPVNPLPVPGSTPLVSLPDGALDIFTYFNQTTAVRGVIGSGLLTKASALMLATEKARQKLPFDPNLRVAAADGPPLVPMTPTTVPLAPIDPPATGGITLPPVSPMAPPKPGDSPPPLAAPIVPMGGFPINLDPPLPEPPKPAAPPKPDPMPMGGGVTLPLLPKPGDLPVPAKPVDPPNKLLDPPPMLVVPKPADVGLPGKSLDPPPLVNPKPVDVKPLVADPKTAPSLGSPVPTPDPKVESAATFDRHRTLPAGPREDADSYDEDWYRCRQDGETFATISKGFYYHEKYEQALRLYNLDRLGTENLRQERPGLQKDAVIRIPPLRILERKYPAAIQGLTAGPRTATPVGSPAPLAALGPVVADRSDGGNGAVEYEVTKPGMTLRDIAKEVLGNSEQWNRIFLLNRWVNSSEPVPVGAKIYVPRPNR